MGVARLRCLICNPPAWVLHRIWALFLVLLGIKSGIDWGDITVRTLGQAPPVRSWLCWELLVGAGNWEGELGVLLHLGAAPSVKKKMRSEGKPDSSPNSLSTSNQTCFLGFSLVCREVLHCSVLFLDSWDLGCSLRFSMEQWSHSSAGQDHGGLGVGTSAGLHMRGDFDATSTHSLTWNRSVSYPTGIIHSAIPPQASAPLPPNLGSISGFWKAAQLAPFCSIGQF